MSINLADAITRNALMQQMQRDLDLACKKEFEEDPRKHLGASIIGHDCAAYGWNTFRWLRFEEFSGRMLRLFNRGHEEERRFIRWLTAMGFQVFEYDPQTGKQFRIGGAKGHFGGSLDGIAIAPVRYNIEKPLLTEFKTHSDKSFKKLKAEGVKKAKPQHFRQMCSYGRAYDLSFGLYCAVNKNDDDIYFEIVELDYSEADHLFRKAENIIFSQMRPNKIAQTATFATCKFCDFASLCHGIEIPSKNCRSCLHAYPTEGGEWTCFNPQLDPQGAVIPADFIPHGCDAWSRIA